jgi:rhamnogalacturonyl hydrolase YesR
MPFNKPHGSALAAVAALSLLAGLSLHAQPMPTQNSTIPGGGLLVPNQVTLTGQLSPEIKPMPVLEAMQRVADWQLAHLARHPATDWLRGAGFAGMMALAGISGDAKYREAMLAMGDTNAWKPGPRKFHADDHCIAQAYAELYLLYREPRMIAPLRQRFDDILEHPSMVASLDFSQTNGQALERWSWCDALFMAPPAWMRLYEATDDERYLNFAVSNWWSTTDFLYDKEEHLFFRDSTYFKKTEANGKKVFWSRGNGWVMAGLVRVLQYLPNDHPDRPRFEQLFKDMADKVLGCQQSDGLWRASLLDPESYPLKETSGSGFYTYALAWGVNQGLLERAKFEPGVRLAWAALVGYVDDQGKLTHVQPVGADPKKFAPDSTEVYGVGAFLLAGSEIYRLAVLDNAKPVDEPQPTPPGLDGKPMGGGLTLRLKSKILIEVSNPAAFRRESETVELDGRDLANHSFVQRTKWAVMDGVSSRILDSQTYSEPDSGGDKLLFQVDLAPHETRTYYILDAAALPVVPPPIIKTFARQVPERYDDFAWESDRIAHRAYGLALIPAEGTISSAPDVWIKKDRRLVVNIMYVTGHYHDDNGEFMDDYRVGHSRGCGGLGVWDGSKLFTSSNYRSWKIITTGPIRSEFELTYDAWDAGLGRKVSETKRYTIDAGSWFTKARSTFASDDQSPLSIGVGLAERACGPAGEELIGQDQAAGWMTYWQPEDQPKGTTATAVVLPKGSVAEFTNDNPAMPDAKIHAVVPQPTVEGAPPIRNLLAITQAEIGKPFEYYLGACWDRSGDFTNHVQWEEYVKRFAERRDQPLRVTFGN